MVLKKDEVLKKVSDILGDRNDDEAIGFIEDLSDTIEDYDKKLGEDWKTKYEENDKAWREKYKARFFDATPDEHTDEVAEQIGEQVEEKELTFDALFKEE